MAGAVKLLIVGYVFKNTIDTFGGCYKYFFPGDETTKKTDSEAKRTFFNGTRSMLGHGLFSKTANLAYCVGAVEGVGPSAQCAVEAVTGLPEVEVDEKISLFATYALLALAWYWTCPKDEEARKELKKDF